MSSLLPLTQTWAIWTALLAAAAFGMWAETTRVGKKISGAVMTMGFSFVLSNLGVIPASGVAVYDVVWSYLVPLAIPLLLLRADIRRIIRESGPTLGAFSLGVVGTVIGTIVAYHVIPFDGDTAKEAWKLAGIFSATYIGGTINYYATAEAMQLRSGDLLSAGVAADNLMMVLYFFILFALPSINAVQRFFPKRPIYDNQEAASVSLVEGSKNTFPSLPKTTFALALSALICAVGYGAARFLDFNGAGILIITAATVVLASVFPKKLAKLEGAEVVGAFLMQIVFAVIGASANILMVARVGPILFLFAGVILTIHLVFLLAGGFIFKLDLREMVIASNANMGGPTTAAAMAVARRWHKLVLPAILVGTFGYAIATFIGVGLGNWLK